MPGNRVPGGRHGSRRDLEDAARAVVAAAVRPVERVDLDAGARVRRVDEEAAADVHPDVAEAAEEDEVTGPQACARHRTAEAPLRARVVRKRAAEVGVDEAGETGAVEAGGRRRAAPDV